MSLQEVRSGRGIGSNREGLRLLVLASLIVGGIGFYLALRAPGARTDGERNLLPYQVLARTLSASEQQVHGDLRRGLPAAEAERARLSRWPDPVSLGDRHIPPFDTAGPGALEWRQFSQGATTNYLGLPSDPAAPAWLLAVREPEPNTPPDPAPLDEEHHRLPDGTTLHIYVWMHRFGGRVTPRFVPQPQTDGWIQVFTVPPNPVLPAR